MSEKSEITDYLMDYIKRTHQQFAYKVPGTRYGVVGLPDIIACLSGLFVGIEVKIGTNQATPAQKLRIREIIRAGGRAFVVRDLDGGRRLIDMILTEARNLGAAMERPGPLPEGVAIPDVRRAGV
jgi:hypothetical protein